MYHWNALNWLFKLFDWMVGIRLPKNCDCCWACAGWKLICVCVCVCVGLISVVPTKLLLRMLDWLLLICNADGGVNGTVGDITPAAGAFDVAILTGLCNFNWFIDNVGPVAFVLPDIKLSKSMFIGPAFVQVEPTGMFALACCCIRLFSLLEFNGWRMLFVGCRMSPEKKIKKNYLKIN